MSKKILVVDDDPAVLKSMVKLLEVFDYETLKAKSGNEALALVQKTNDISFVISDMRMPDGDGLDLLKKMRASRVNIPFLLLTGFADITTSEALASGALAVMTKPFDASRLMALIEEHTKT